jgi:hypothetical protein
MTTKEKIIFILEMYSTTKELKSGENANIIDDDDFEKIAYEILSKVKKKVLPSNDKN